MREIIGLRGGEVFAFGEEVAAQIFRFLHRPEEKAQAIGRFAEREFVRQSERLVHDLIGECLEVIIRLHPAHLDTATIGDVAEGLPGIKRAVLGADRACLAVECLSVELANEIAVLRSHENPPRFAWLAVTR